MREKLAKSRSIIIFTEIVSPIKASKMVDFSPISRFMMYKLFNHDSTGFFISIEILVDTSTMTIRYQEK